MWQGVTALAYSVLRPLPRTTESIMPGLEKYWTAGIVDRHITAMGRGGGGGELPIISEYILNRLDP